METNGVVKREGGNLNERVDVHRCNTDAELQTCD